MFTIHIIIHHKPNLLRVFYDLTFYVFFRKSTLGVELSTVNPVYIIKSSKNLKVHILKTSYSTTRWLIIFMSNLISVMDALSGNACLFFVISFYLVFKGIEKNNVLWLHSWVSDWTGIERNYTFLVTLLSNILIINGL